MTVGIGLDQDQSEVVTVRHGRFRVQAGYDPSVRIPDVLLKSVAFIGEVSHRVGTEVFGDLHATGFFVAVAAPKALGHFVYFVTAKHVAAGLQDREVYFLVNKRGGGVLKLEPPPNSPWCCHPSDDTADVAIMSVPIDPRAEIIGIPEGEFVSAEDFLPDHRGVEAKYGIGDETVTVGLFTEAPGTSRSFPIVRHGNVAMLPTEQIQTELGYADVYLVEARSIGGMSGSPVWIRPTLLLIGKQGETIIPTGVVGPGKLLGLMHGHWDIKESEMNKPKIIHDRQNGVNLGIAMVVPASKILETINQEGLVELRAMADERESKRGVPGMDSAKPRKPIPDPSSFSKQDFEDALKKATRKVGKQS